MGKVFIKVVGCCRRRSLDAAKLANYFKVNDFDVLKNPEEADYIFLVTCAYKKSKEDDCFELIRVFGGGDYKGELIVLGCLPGISPSKFKKEFKGKYLVTERLNEIDNFDLFSDFKVKFKDLPDANDEFFLGEEKKDSGLLRISRGCIANCSYCAIPKAVGGLVSKPIDVCVKEYKKLLKGGCKEFNVCAENVGAYGIDIGSSLPELLEKFSEASEKLKVNWSLHEMHPKWVVMYKDALMGFIEGGEISQIGCTIQSGSKRILKLMNRYWDIEKIKEVVLDLKKANSDLYIYTHVLVGFPTETEKDFDKTLESLNEINFDLVIFYVYTDREGTVADGMDDKVTNEQKTKRLKRGLNFCKDNKINAISDEVCFF